MLCLFKKGVHFIRKINEFTTVHLKCLFFFSLIRFKVLESFFFFYMNHFIEQRCIKLLKCDTKDINNVK